MDLVTPAISTCLANLITNNFLFTSFYRLQLQVMGINQAATQNCLLQDTAVHIQSSYHVL